MGSSYGTRHGLKGYDRFRTGLSYQQVFEMLMDNADDPADWKYKKRGTVLGKWHQIKMEMYERYLAERGKRKAPASWRRKQRRVRRSPRRGKRHGTKHR